MVGYEPVTEEMKARYTPMLERCDRTIHRLMATTVDIGEFLLGESDLEIELWQKWRSDHFDAQQARAAHRLQERGNVHPKATHLSWPDKHREIFRTHNLVYPVVLESLYSAGTLKNMRTLPRRSQDCIDGRNAAASSIAKLKLREVFLFCFGY